MENEIANDSGENVGVEDAELTEGFTEANIEHQDESGNTETNPEEKVERLTKLPWNRIKNIMKMDPEVSLASQDAVFLISKATEYFIQTLAKEAQSFTALNKKKTVQKKDVESAIASVESLVFLEGALDI